MKELGFVHRFTLAGAGEDRTLLLLHGTGGNEEDLIPLGRELLPDAALLSPRGQVSESGMPRFFRRIAEGVFDLDDLHQRTLELAAFLDAAKSEYGLNGRMIAVGYSNGANIAASLMLRRPGVLSGSILFRAMVPFVPEDRPSLEGTRILLAAGTRDPIADPSQTSRLSEILRSSGADLTVHWHDGGHELGPDDIAAARRWIHLFK